MNTLVLYDSAYGNTERIARAIGSQIAGDVEVLHIDKASASTTEQVDFLVVGSPTQGGKPTKAVQDFLTNLPPSSLAHVGAAAFDTRLSGKVVGIFGFAAGKIADMLVSKGAALASSPQGFLVKGKEGPLKEGELERAALWANETGGSLSPLAVAG
jgi:flavodoxin I